MTRVEALAAAVRIAVVVVLAATTVRVAQRLLPRAVARIADVNRRDARWDQRVQTLSHLLAGVVAAVVWVLALVTVLDQLGVNVGPLVAGAGVVGLAVGFGAQQLVRDVITGFFVLVEDQFGVGDRVTIGPVSGVVETMSLRLTRVRGDDGVLHHVRNGDLGVVSNASRGFAVATVELVVPPDRDLAAAVERVRAAMAALVEAGMIDGLLLADPQVLGMTGLRDGTTPVLTVTARTTPDGRGIVQRELLRAGRDAVSAPDAPARRRSGRR